MKFIQNTFKKTLNWSKNHFWLSVIIIAGAFYFLSGNSGNVGIYPSKGGFSANDMARSESIPMGAISSYYESDAVQESGMGKRSIGIMPPVFAEDIAPGEEQKLVKNASLTIEVPDTKTAREQVELTLKEIGGLVFNSNSWEVRPRVLQENLTLRIPAEKLDATMNQFSELGIKKSESMNVSDITAQYRDNVARIKNLETRRERLRTMMDRDTENLSDVLQIDRELANVQNELDQLERTQKRNDNDVLYSTLNLTIQPEPQIGDLYDPTWSPKKTWRQSVNELLESLQGIADKAIKLVVFAPLWVPVLLILWAIKRRFFKS